MNKNTEKNNKSHQISSAHFEFNSGTINPESGEKITYLQGFIHSDYKQLGKPVQIDIKKDGEKNV